MNNEYTSKYPTIVTDEKPNSPNRSMQKKISIEEYYDLMHHTHKISDLIDDNDADEKTIAYLINAVSELKIIVNSQQNTINELKEIIDTQTKSIESLNDESLNIADWDLETEGNQDINGNDLNAT